MAWSHVTLDEFILDHFNLYRADTTRTHKILLKTQHQPGGLDILSCLAAGTSYSNLRLADIWTLLNVHLIGFNLSTCIDINIQTKLIETWNMKKSARNNFSFNKKIIYSISGMTMMNGVIYLLGEQLTVYHVIRAWTMCLSIWTELSECFGVQSTYMGNSIY